jgi:hypothetical protein
MRTPARTDRDANHDLAVIAVRVLDDAHMAWVAAEVDSDHALHGWFAAGAPKGAGGYLTYRAAVDREKAAARDLGRLAELTQPCREWLARSRWPLRQPLLRSTEACAGRRFCPPATTRLGLPRLRVA